MDINQGHGCTGQTRIASGVDVCVHTTEPVRASAGSHSEQELAKQQRALYKLRVQLPGCSQLVLCMRSGTLLPALAVCKVRSWLGDGDMVHALSCRQV